MSYCMPPECDGIPNPSRHAIEPDWVASECDDQLPAFSKIGRGPRGKGVYTEIEKTGDGQVIIHFKDDETGEEIGNTGDIAAGRISVSYAPENPVAGDEVKMFVSVRNGSSVANYVVPVPSGAHGSRIYLFPGSVMRNRDDTYQCSVDDLTIYGLQRWESKPEPRPNDVILFNYEDSDGNGFAFGTIEAVEKGQVVYTARVFNTLPGVSILPDGTWAVDGESTGIKAQGPKGEDAKIKVRREGDKAVITATDSDGETTAEVLDGKDGRDAKLTVQRAENGAVLTATDSDGVTAATVKDGSDGEDGSDGLPARLTLGSVHETSQVSVTLVPGRVQDNEYIISFGLPRGADGKSIDINGGVYRVDQLPDFDETPVNDAFVVLDDDDRFDLYIRGKEAVIAEEGGPWTVVEDWQGVNGYSMRMLAGRKISTEEVLRIPVGEVETAFVPHNGLRDGDLVFDDNGTIGIVGSAMDDSGDYTVSHIDKMNVHWDNIDGKPALASTHSIELAEADGQVTADLRLSGEHSNAEFNTVDGKVAANLDHNVAPAGLGDHSLYFSSDGFKNDSGTIALSDAVVESLGKANSAVQEDDLTAAISAEASAREKADQLLETEIDGKLDTADLVAGKNISITHDPESGKVTIDNTMKLVDSASGPVAHIDNNAFAQKPLGLNVYGNTRQNLWKNPSGTNNGVTVTSNEDGTISISGTATSTANIFVNAYILVPGKSYVFSANKVLNTYGATIYQRNSSDGNIRSVSIAGTLDSSLSKLVTIGTDVSYCSFHVNTPSGVTADINDFRVMLREATEDEIAAAQQTASTLQEGGTADIPQDYPVTLPAYPDELAESEPFDWCPPGLNSISDPVLTTNGKNLFNVVEGRANGVTCTKNADGSYHLSGTASAASFFRSSGINGNIVNRNEGIPLETFTTSTRCIGSFPATGVYVRVRKPSGAYYKDNIPEQDGTLVQSSSYIRDGVSAFEVVVTKGSTVDCDLYVQFELGATATSYEPYVGSSTPIDLQGNVLSSLPDGTRDVLTVDANGACSIEKRTVKLVFDGSEDWRTSESGKRYYLNIKDRGVLGSDGLDAITNMYCDSFPIETSNRTYAGVIGCNIYIYAIYICDGTMNDVEGFKSRLATNNVTVIAELQIPQTVEFGSIEVPELPSPTANVWATAEVPAEVELEYLTEDAEVFTRFLKPSNIKAGSNVSIDVDGNDVIVSSSGVGGGTGSMDTATDEEFQEYMGY